VIPEVLACGRVGVWADTRGNRCSSGGGEANCPCPLEGRPVSQYSQQCSTPPKCQCMSILRIRDYLGRPWTAVAICSRVECVIRPQVYPRQQVESKQCFFVRHLCFFMPISSRLFPRPLSPLGFFSLGTRVLNTPRGSGLSILGRPNGEIPKVPFFVSKF